MASHRPEGALFAALDADIKLTRASLRAPASCTAKILRAVIKAGPAALTLVAAPTAGRPDPEVGLLSDTASTCFEVDEADEPTARDDRGEPLPGDHDGGERAAQGFRASGKSQRR
jgi:hypothetical protein